MNPLSFSDYCTHLYKKGMPVDTAQEDHVKLLEKIIYRRVRKELKKILAKNKADAATPAKHKSTN